MTSNNYYAHNFRFYAAKDMHDCLYTKECNCNRYMYQSAWHCYQCVEP